MKFYTLYPTLETLHPSPSSLHSYTIHPAHAQGPALLKEGERARERQRERQRETEIETRTETETETKTETDRQR